MKLVTWNINGLRSGWEKFTQFLESEQPDIVALQEIKVDDARLPDEYKSILGYKSYWFHAQKPGYSGVAVYSKIVPKKITLGLGEEEFDREGRVIILDFDNFTFVNFYFPHSGRELERLDFKMRFNKVVERYVKKVSEESVILCGDFNVAREEIDLARPKDNAKNAGFTEIERNWIRGFLGSKWIDAFRYLHPDTREYTWWSQRQGVRAKNIGWRIDYFFLSEGMKSMIRGCKIDGGVYGSDHAPVILEIN